MAGVQDVTGRDAVAVVASPDGLGAAVAVPADFAGVEEAGRGISQRSIEIGTALFLAAFGGLAIWDSLRLGAGWAADGPQSGYFPFWIGTILIAAALGQLATVLRSRGGAAGGPAMFLSFEQARTVGRVLIPTTVFVAAIPFLGIYVASTLLVAWFMARLGDFRWPTGLAAGAAAASVTFVVFEMWFLVALPKGPLEEWLGLA